MSLSTTHIYQLRHKSRNLWLDDLVLCSIRYGVSDKFYFNHSDNVSATWLVLDLARAVLLCPIGEGKPHNLLLPVERLKSLLGSCHTSDGSLDGRGPLLSLSLGWGQGYEVAE